MEKQEGASKVELKNKIDEIYGYGAETKQGQEDETFISKFMKYLERMRDRQMQRAKTKMRPMI